MSTINRFFRLAYPGIIFFSLFLAWNSVVQMNGFAGFGGPSSDQTRSNWSSAQVQTSCTMEHLNFLEARSCKEEKSELKKLMDTNENQFSNDAIVKAAHKDTGFQLRSQPN